MTPLEYKTFCETTYACPEGTDREEYLRLLLIDEEYLCLLLIEKLGKVASLLAKAMRDGVSRVEDGYTSDPKIDHTYGPEAVDREALKKELGDVMWCAAMLDDRDWRQNIVAWPVEKPWWLNDRPASEMLGDIWAEFDDGASALMWACFAVIKLGFAPQSVALANVEKLRGRRERGTIHGAGDER